jgi:peptidyl-prolyl cis-trans isomerase A (cyclophilin A)
MLNPGQAFFCWVLNPMPGQKTLGWAYSAEFESGAIVAKHMKDIKMGHRLSWRVLLLAAVLSLFAASAVHAQTTVRFRTVLGTFDVELFDQETPITVANFLGIVNRGDYDNTIIHRSAKDNLGDPFVVQGGGYFATFPVPTQTPDVPTILNEPGFSNTIGTIAMAKRGDGLDPENSATNQWFINMNDNSFLDDSNGGFTVFGRVLGNGMGVVNAIAAVPVVNVDGQGFSDLPLIDFDGLTITTENLVIIETITVLQDDPDPDPDPDPRPDPTSLYFPVLPQGTEGLNGLALLNRSSEAVQLGLELIADDSTSVATLDLQPEIPVAQLVSEIFGENAAAPAWIRLNSQGTPLASFFQFGKTDLSQLDGGVAVSELSKTLYFTRVFDGPTAFRGQLATTTLSILNPNSAQVLLRLTYVPPTGDAVAFVLPINPNSFLFESSSELFGANLSGGYLKAEVIQGDGVVGFEILELPDRSTVMGLNAALDSASNQVFSAQLAIQEGLFTSLNLVNTTSEPRSVTFTAIDSDGSNLGDSVVMTLEAGGQLSQDAGVLFVDPGQDFTGSLRVDFDGPGVVGDVIFGDAANLDFAASLPLQAQTFKEAIFSQLANGSGFFTGVALYNPGTVAAEFTLEVVSSEGVSVGQITELLGAGQRVSRLVDQFVTNSVGQVGGFVTVVSDQPLVGQMLFGVTGAEGVTLFSAVPPTVVN